ncbi:hypothetical protein HII36_42990 [Nonomuraea sp. NN258]|uniref:hypothetical protein n=1 Tax=Nonomuraea antri TaxID=2730852 RepID=UPI00156805E2|nr:hypothetical protein [Nonomuraea antri]NRQ38545.1 hypothetical protein [Nonomuraea antri]
MKSFQIVLASSDQLMGRLVSVFVSKSEEEGVTTLIHIDHIERDAIPSVVKAVRKGFEGFRLLPEPVADPTTPFQLIVDADTETPEMRLTPGGLIEYLPKDVISAELEAQAAQAAADLLCFYAPPANYRGRGPRKGVPPSL